MLPPILDIYLVWHPGDPEGHSIAAQLLDHFHGTPYTGLAGGSVEVYTRSAGWAPDSGAPRPIPFMEPPPHQLPAPLVTAVVPVMGVSLARAVEDPSAEWRGYLAEMLSTAEQAGTVGVFPVRLPGWHGGGQLGRMIDGIQALRLDNRDDVGGMCREIAQQITQMIDEPSGNRLTVFISHTRRHSPGEKPDVVEDLVALVRSKISQTHLRAYFDETDLQPGSSWENELIHNASRNSLLAVRTDLYSSREWCQKEVLAAKRAGRPIVTLDAIRFSGERGSFLMDHVPIVRYQDQSDEASSQSIEGALNLLVDRALRHALWTLQVAQLDPLGFDWTPPEAPEPSTIIPWLDEQVDNLPTDQIMIMHPDPPLGPAEEELLLMLLRICRVSATVDIVTPRTYAARGGKGL